MIRRGIAPFLECSSRGDRRFSAFYAFPMSLSGRSIEAAYQAMKVFEDGSTGLDWRAAKGRRPVNGAECRAAYTARWLEWVVEQDLFGVLEAATGLQDTFGQEGHVCQADVLWMLRSASLACRSGLYGDEVSSLPSDYTSFLIGSLIAPLVIPRLSGHDPLTPNPDGQCDGSRSSGRSGVQKIGMFRNNEQAEILNRA